MPIKGYQTQGLREPQSSRNPIICMVPPLGNSITGQVNRVVTNKINAPGCTLEQTSRTRPDGSVENRRTLICTEVTITKGSRARVRPAPGSKQAKEDEKMRNSFGAKSRRGGSSSSKKR